MSCFTNSPGCEGPLGTGIVCGRCRRKAVRAIPPMPRVNDAKGANRVQWAREGVFDTPDRKRIPVNRLGLPMETNCALATAAGVCNLASLAVVETTGSVAARYGRAQGNDTMTPNEKGVDAQAKSILEYCQAHPALAGRNASTWGSQDLPMDRATAMGKMGGFPAGTLFAVCVQGLVPEVNLRKGATSPYAVHWLTAARESGGVWFYDFQTDWKFTEYMAIDGPVEVTRRPVPTCLGKDFADDCKMSFVAFSTS